MKRYIFIFIFYKRFLETDRYQWYGISVIQDLMRGIPWQASGYFPRVSLCDFTVLFFFNFKFIFRKFDGNKFLSSFLILSGQCSVWLQSITNSFMSHYSIVPVRTLSCHTVMARINSRPRLFDWESKAWSEENFKTPIR